MDKLELKLVIGDKHLSSWSMRPWLLMKQMEIPFEEVLIRLDQSTTKAEIAKVSPSARVPVLFDRDLKIWDSLAICEYLAEKFPRLPFWPEQTKSRAWARSISAEMHSSFPNLRKECSMDLLNIHSGKKVSPEVECEMSRIDQIFSECRTAHKAKGNYLFGDFGIADAMYMPVISRICSYELKLKQTASIEYYNFMIQSPLFKFWVTEATKERP